MVFRGPEAQATRSDRHTDSPQPSERLEKVELRVLRGAAGPGAMLEAVQGAARAACRLLKASSAPSGSLRGRHQTARHRDTERLGSGVGFLRALETDGQPLLGSATKKCEKCSL
eukprot:scaffold207_cov267-Pinguiococcus_pyrenoidosus.AAC.20